MARFDKGDVVRFENEGSFVVGKVWVVDKNGALGLSEASYDVFDEEAACLYKHVPESRVSECLPI